jgi:hypothetical protein
MFRTHGTIAEDVHHMDDYLNNPLVRVVFVLITMGIISGLLPLVFLIDWRIPDAVLYWLVILVSGLCAGAISRILLRSSPVAFQFTVAFAAILFSSFIFGWLTMNFIGFNWQTDADIFSILRWAAELGLASLMAALAVRAWNVSASKVKAPSSQVKIKSQPLANGKVESGAQTRKSETKPRRISYLRKNHRPKKQPGINHPSPREKNLAPLIRLEEQSETAGKSPWKTLENRVQKLWQDARMIRHRYETPAASIPAAGRIRTRKALARARKTRPDFSNVKLFGEVEHRCPYCLEVVHKNDRRGVKICPICQTHHHLDCWNITGMCQVPHQSE